MIHALGLSVAVAPVSVAVGLAATLRFRGFSFWLPLLPGIVFARRESSVRA